VLVVKVIKRREASLFTLVVGFFSHERYFLPLYDALWIFQVAYLIHIQAKINQLTYSMEQSPL